MKKILLSLICLFGVIGCGVKNNKLDLKKVQQTLSSSEYFSNHEVVSTDTISNRYSIDISKFDETLMLSSTKYDDASIVFIVHPNNESTKKEFENFIDSYNSQWVGMNYFPEQKELVENALYTTYNGYLIYIVSNNNDAIINLIKNN